MPSTPEIRSLDPDDLDALGDLKLQAFGGPRQEMALDRLTVPPERTVAAYDGSRLVGTVSVYDYRQWFGGRAVPCGGVAGVTIAADQRGKGLARTLLGEATARMRGERQAVSSLFPTTASLYRSLGWEIAGWWARRSAPISGLPLPSGDVVWTPVDHTDPVLGEVHDVFAARRDGWITADPSWWERGGLRRTAGPKPSWSWVGRRGDEPVAMVVYHHADSERGLYDLEVEYVAGIDGPALRDALAFLGGHGTTVDRVITTLPERLLAAHVVEGSRTRTAFDWPWMLRIIDLPGAVAARGWPAGVTGEVHLDVADPPVVDPAGPTGPHVLTIDDGTARCEPGGDGTVRLGVGALAALYAGGADPAALAFDGALECDDDRSLSLLRAAFAGDPTLPIFF